MEDIPDLHVLFVLYMSTGLEAVDRARRKLKILLRPATARLQVSLSLAEVGALYLTTRSADTAGSDPVSCEGRSGFGDLLLRSSSQTKLSRPTGEPEFSSGCLFGTQFP